MIQVHSPLTGTSNVTKKHILSIEKIKKKYLAELNTDVSPFFENCEELSIYQCNESGLKFYHPFTVAGDGKFYSDLEKEYKGYYTLWRWEHEKAIKFIKKADKVLEIGCGKGYFLEKLIDKNAEPIGLDFNPDAIVRAQEKGIAIFDETISAHSEKKSENYDVVCAFQLFEHVNEVKEFLNDSIKCLKKGGLFIIGVPNNQSIYFSKDIYHTLNLPPHHMLLWDEKSLSFIAKQYNLEIVEISKEPLTRLHKGSIYKVWLQNIIGDNLFTKIILISTRFFVKQLPVFNNDGITSIAIFRKK